MIWGSGKSADFPEPFFHRRGGGKCRLSLRPLSGNAFERSAFISCRLKAFFREKMRLSGGTLAELVGAYFFAFGATRFHLLNAWTDVLRPFRENAFGAACRTGALLTQTACRLKPHTLRSANAVAPNAKYKELFRYLCAERSGAHFKCLSAECSTAGQRCCTEYPKIARMLVFCLRSVYNKHRICLRRAGERQTEQMALFGALFFVLRSSFRARREHYEPDQIYPLVGSGHYQQPGDPV